MRKWWLNLKFILFFDVIDLQKYSVFIYVQILLLVLKKYSVFIYAQILLLIFLLQNIICPFVSYTKEDITSPIFKMRIIFLALWFFMSHIWHFSGKYYMSHLLSYLQFFFIKRTLSLSPQYIFYMSFFVPFLSVISPNWHDSIMY